MTKEQIDSLAYVIEGLSVAAGLKKLGLENWDEVIHRNVKILQDIVDQEHNQC